MRVRWSDVSRPSASASMADRTCVWSARPIWNAFLLADVEQAFQGACPACGITEAAAVCEPIQRTEPGEIPRLEHGIEIDPNKGLEPLVMEVPQQPQSPAVGDNAPTRG